MLKIVKAYGADNCRRFYENVWGDLVVEVSTITHQHTSGSLMKLWVDNKYLPKFIEKTLCVRVYFEDENGNCIEKFNPQVKIVIEKYKVSKDTYKNTVKSMIEFEWVLEATEENEQKLLNEIERRYNEFYR